MADKSPLLKIPTELRLEICSWVLASSDRPTDQRGEGPGWQSALGNFRTLGNLAASCKSLYNAAAPLLYELVVVSIFEPSTFIQLLRHFSLFPDVALHVRTVSITDKFYFDANWRIKRSQSRFLLNEALRMGFSLDSFNLSTSTDETRRVLSLLLALLLARVPTIHTLEVAVLPFPVAELFDYASRLPDSFLLGSLCHLKVNPPISKVRSKWDHKSESLAAFLRHTPALTYLDVEATQGHAMPIIRDPLPQLKHLRLPEIRLDHLANITLFCPRLESFRLGGYVDVDLGQLPGFSSDSFTVDRVLESLLPLRSALCDLEVSWDQLHVPDFGYLGLLPRFNSLRSLSLVFLKWPVGGDTNMLVELLPPTIESLTLGGNGIGIQILSIAHGLRARKQRGRIPKLREFKFVLVDLSTDTRDVFEQVIASAFAGTDVSCREENPPWVLGVHAAESGSGTISPDQRISGSPD